MNWWLRTYHQDGTSGEVVGPGSQQDILREALYQLEGYHVEVIQWEPGQPIPPSPEWKCGEG